jgi:hypothetical protein
MSLVVVELTTALLYWGVLLIPQRQEMVKPKSDSLSSDRAVGQSTGYRHPVCRPSDVLR